MSQSTLAPPGAPSFLELGVTDPVRAKAFYSGLFAWKATAVGSGFHVDLPGTGVGVHGDDPSKCFVPYFRVSDLDAALARVRALGGKTEGYRSESATFGRFAECEDDQGVRFGLHEPPAPPK